MNYWVSNNWLMRREMYEQQNELIQAVWLHIYDIDNPPAKYTVQKVIDVAWIDIVVLVWPNQDIPNNCF